MSRSRAWCFTLNNYSSLEEQTVQEIGCRFLIYGRERGQQGTPHLQGYIYFDDAKTMKTLKKLIRRAHFSSAKGTPQQNVEYCSKEGDVYRKGDIPAQGRAKYALIEEVMKDPESNFHLYQQYKKTYQEYKLSKGPAEKQRRLILCHHKDEDKILDKHKGESIFIDQIGDDNYDNESVYITDEYPPKWIKYWVRGIPQKKRVGYEFRYIDPDIIYILFRSKDRRRSLYNEYEDYLDDYKKC